MIQRLFWNAEQARLRTGWRLVVLFVATLAASLLAYSGLTDGLGSNGVRLLYVLLAAGALVAVRRLVDRRPLRSLGLSGGRPGRQLVVGLSIGAVAAAVLVLLLVAGGWLELSMATTIAWSALLIHVLVFVLSVSYEELLVRGYLLHNLTDGLTGRRISGRVARWIAWLITSVLFALMHAGNPNVTPVAAFNLFLLGLLFGLPVVLRASLPMAIGLHLAWNVALADVFGVPVSGVVSSASVLTSTIDGPAIWTGGAFGPEGGVAATLVVTLFGILLVITRRRHEQIRPLQATAL